MYLYARFLSLSPDWLLAHAGHRAALRDPAPNKAGAQNISHAVRMLAKTQRNTYSIHTDARDDAVFQI